MDAQTKRRTEMSKSDEQIQRESSKKIAAANRKQLPTTSRKGGGVADWASASAEDVLRLVCAVSVAGGAVRFGYTRDGGAYSIGLYLGDDSKTYYCNDAEGIGEQITELIEYFG
jgi:hypothetical protein